jgi:hypothetical protein
VEKGIDRDRVIIEDKAKDTVGVAAQPGARTVLPDRTAWMAW